jgi:hypothetical protein
MFTNTPPPLHAPQAAARLNEGARTFIIYFYSFLCFTRFPLRVSLSLYASLSTRLSLRVSLYASLSTRLYVSLSMRLSIRLSLCVSLFI